MSLIIQYCEKCGERVDPGDIESGAALHYKDESYCKACKDSILPELEQDPEFRKHQQQRGTPRPSSRSTKRPDSGVLDLPRGAAASGRSRRQSGVMQQRAGSRRASGQAAQPASSRGAASSGGGNTMAYVLCGAGGVVALVVLLVLFNMGGRKEDPTPSTTKKAQQEKQPTPQKQPEQQPNKIKLTKKPSDTKQQQDTSLVAIQFRKLLAYRKEHPEQHKTFLEKLESYLPETSGTQYQRQALKLKRDAQEALDRDAKQVFAVLREDSRKLAEEGSYQLALAKWDQFSSELLTNHWQAMIQQERNRLLELQRKAEEARFVKGTIPSGGSLLEVFNGHSMAGWRIARNAPAWTARSGILAVDNSSGSEMSFAFFFDRDGDKRYQIKDFYLTFELQVQAGWLKVLGRIPAQNGPKHAEFDAYPTSFEAGKWYRAHLVVVGQKAEWWVEKAVSLQTKNDFTSPQGAVGLAAGPKGRFTARGFQMRVLQRGDPAPLKKKDPPKQQPSGDAKDFFNGKNLEGWDPRGKWSVDNQGVIQVDSTNHDQSLLIKLNPAWTDYTLEFEARRVIGEFAVVLRCFQEGGRIKSGGGFRFAGSRFTSSSAWYKVVMTASGNTIKFDIPQLNWSQTTNSQSASGGVIFVVKRGHKVELRNLKLKLHKK